MYIYSPKSNSFGCCRVILLRITDLTFDNFCIIQDGHISSARLMTLYVRLKAAKLLLQSLVDKKMEKLHQTMEAA